jgi:hypothetical protein
MTKIKNINGAPQHIANCKCGSWLKHWKKHSGRKCPTFCIVCVPDCLDKVTVGALVQKVNDSDTKWYIAPLCENHAATPNTEFSIYNTWPLIEVECVEVCETDFFSNKKQTAIDTKNVI